jgi:hypothetical protein
MPKPTKILLLAGTRFYFIGTVRDHLDAFKKYSAYDFDIASPKYAEKNINLDDYDGVLIHYSTRLDITSEFSNNFRQKIAQFEGVKIAFLQDEYRNIDQTISALKSANIHILYSVVGESVVDIIYKNLKNVKKIVTLTGFCPDYLKDLTPIPYEKRPIDVSYRARKLPYWLGELSQKKWRMGKVFKEKTKDQSIKTDIAYDEGKRIYGKKWITFLKKSKAVLGSESTISVCDFTGAIQKKVDAYTSKCPHASFEEVRDRFFKNEDGKIIINVISPRIFEYAGCRTLMILSKGYYSGILTPWKHYVPFEEDGSNIEEILDILNHPSKAQKIIDQAYLDLIEGDAWSYQSFIKSFDTVLNPYLPLKGPSKKSYTWSIKEKKHLFFDYVLEKATLFGMRILIKLSLLKIVRKLYKKTY